jgi:hypothetical protein
MAFKTQDPDYMDALLAGSMSPAPTKPARPELVTQQRIEETQIVCHGDVHNDEAGPPHTDGHIDTGPDPHIDS